MLGVGVDPSDQSDRLNRWEWELESDGIFSVRYTRCHIDNNMILGGLFPKRRCNFAPIKLNVFLQRVVWDMITTTISLVGRCVDVPTILCPCSLDVDDCKHVFVNCKVASQIWIKVVKWLDLPIPLFINFIELFLGWTQSLYQH